jgi:hypothetical protein
VNFPFFVVIGVFDARNGASLERISFFEQLIDAFRISAFNVAQSLQVTGLCAGIGRCYASVQDWFVCAGPFTALF